MNKKLQIIYLCIIAGLSIHTSKAQDTIFMSNGNKIISIVKEISDTEIRYKEFTNQDGPVYVIRKSTVNKIRFEDGHQNIFKSENKIILYGRNIINYHLFDVVYQDFKISYENILKRGMLGFQIPVSIGFNNESIESGPYQFKNIIYTGLGVNIYPMGQRMASYFMGPELNVGLGKDYIYYDYWSSSDNYTEFFYGRLLINNGIAFTPIPNLRLTSVLGIGIRYYEAPSSGDDGVKSTAYFSFTMGYRF